MGRSSSCDHRSDKRRKYLDRRESRVSGKIEAEREDRRRRWLKQREEEMMHELYKEKMILRYEIQRAREKERADSERDTSVSQAGSSRNIQNYKSQSLHSLTKSDKPQTPPKTTIMSEKSLFQGPEGTCISALQLKCIKVNIQRSLPSTEVTIKQLQRDIVNPEDIILKRREGEGSKPIFERDELKQAESNTSDVEERRRVIAVFTEHVERSRSPKRPRVSLSSSRTFSRSPQRMSFEHNFRRGEGKHHCDETGHRNCQKESKSAEEYKEKNLKAAESPLRKTKYERSHSKEGEERLDKRERERRQSTDVYHYRSSRDGTTSYRSHQRRSREFSSERRERMTERERDEAMKRRFLPGQHYFEQVAVPFCYGSYHPPYHPNFHPNYAMMPPRGQIPLLRGRFPPGARNGRALPCPPRFITQNAYRMEPIANPRFHRMF
ncbi:female-specific protein transformer isoform X2 [Cephus cinctus]|uniref:Female-specific protein transformer isoform X2 n=1 Tax=Cephus cinctus TaxID=211228 RepID=A0AAJ7FIS1_CEPCN|nr:female-specific protein transformer isoform X2 [Cephus cinctus]